MGALAAMSPSPAPSFDQRMPAEKHRHEVSRLVLTQRRRKYIRSRQDRAPEHPKNLSGLTDPLLPAVRRRRQKKSSAMGTSPLQKDETQADLRSPATQRLDNGHLDSGIREG